MLHQPLNHFYQRNLPHYSKNHVEYFITSRLDGTLPALVVQQIQEEEALEKLKIENRNGEELGRIIRYTLNNPVKAGLVEKWEDWEFNYLNPKYVY